MQLALRGGIVVRQQNARVVREHQPSGEPEVNPFTRLSLGRLIGEIGVIVIGITLGLATDRWVSGIDERNRVAGYISELVDNLQADSATLATAIRRAEQRQRFAVGLLDGGADSLLVDPAAFLQSLETLTWWSPLDHSRET